MIIPKYKWSCPNCGGTISADRLEKGLPCEKCLPTIPEETDIKSIAKALMDNGKLKGYAWLYQLDVDYEDFEKFFEERTGYRLWSAQKGWARRLLLMESLEIVAPTGVGKTTLLSVYAAYASERRGWKVVYLVPTENLVKQTASRISDLSSAKVLAYYSGLSKKRKDEVIKKITNRDFDILVITTGFLQRRFELLKSLSPIELVIVDDVDSLLRQSRNVERVLELLGYDELVIRTALDLVLTKQKLFRSLALGLENKIDELQRKVSTLESNLRLKAPAPKGQLIIASATGRPKGIKHLIFRELLGFEIGGTTDYMRNVIDSFIISNNLLNTAVDIVKKLGRGGLIFVSQSLGKPSVKILIKKLNSVGIKAKPVLAGSRSTIEALLLSNKVDVLVGMASRYGVLVRGIDIPEAIKYAIFLGVPAKKVHLREALLHPKRLLRILLFLAENGCARAKEGSEMLSKLLEKVPEYMLVISILKGKLKAEGILKELSEVTKRYSDLAYQKMKELLDANKIVKIGSLIATREGSGYYIYLIDAPTYLQASGRTSRLLKGSMTLGLSVVIDTHEQKVKALQERLSWMTKSVFKPFSELNIKSIKNEMEISRKGYGRRVNVKTLLLIVESPTKAKTIAWFWGRPSRRKFGRITAYETSVYDEKENTIYLLTVVASRGHLYDLAVNEDNTRFGVEYQDGMYRPIYTTIKRCLKCGYQFTEETDRCPRCGSEAILDTKSVVEVLRKLAVEVDEVVIATDPDREGEKIGWDIALLLKPYNSNISRAKFHEVVPYAVLEAIRSRGPFNKRLIEAQIVRRIEDRWIGFSLSAHLKVTYNKRWLGAGRVQTPILGWIVERYRKWKDVRGYLVLTKLENGKGLKFFSMQRPAIEKDDQNMYVDVIKIEQWVDVAKPYPPFTTDSLLYEAQRSLGMPSWITMKVAQDLFETGLITYHRTDSTRVSSSGLAVARTYLEKKGLLNLYVGRTWSSEGAHEAIRPTRPLDVEELKKAIIEGTIKIPIKLTKLHYKLYDLIFRRFIASQMSESKALYYKVVFNFKSLKSEIERPVKILSKGFMNIYNPGIEPWLLNLKEGSKLKVTETKVLRASKVKLFTSGDVIKLMKENGIGRPSTYSKAIEANIRHGYIITSKKRGYLIPTAIGIEIYKYLSFNFNELISVNTTRKLEENLDRIERGEITSVEVLDELWETLEKRNLIRNYGISEGIVF